MKNASRKCKKGGPHLLPGARARAAARAAAAGAAAYSYGRIAARAALCAVRPPARHWAAAARAARGGWRRACNKCPPWPLHRAPRASDRTIGIGATVTASWRGLNASRAFFTQTPNLLNGSPVRSFCTRL